MKKYFIILVFLCRNFLFAQEFSIFTNLGGDNAWNNPKNWSTNKVPDANDEAYIPSDKTPVLASNCRAKKITVEGLLSTTFIFGGSTIYTDRLIIKKDGKIYMDDNLKILPNQNQLNIENEGEIFTKSGERKSLIIGNNIDSGTNMYINGGGMNGVDFKFTGNSLEFNGGYIDGSANIRTNNMSMSQKSVIYQQNGNTVEESSVLIFCNRNLLIDESSSIKGDIVPASDIGGNINIYAKAFKNYGTLLPGVGFKKNGVVDIRGQNLYNSGKIGGGSGARARKIMSGEELGFSNIIIRADSVVIDQKNSLILADTLRVFGKNITVTSQIEPGIALLNGVEFYTSDDGKIVFITDKFNIFAGGNSRKIFSNNIIPAEQWKLQQIFWGPVDVFPPDTTLIDASAELS